ncbi:putative ent-kaurene synthase protein [Seiridium cardinale]
MDISSSWHHQARALLAALAAQCSLGKGKEVGSMSSSLYDTAWLSMVQKPAKTGFGIDMATTWLFPECFEFVLARQLPSGAWESYATPVDGILNTAAALLSLIKHLEIQPDNQDWLLRSRKAKAALEDILKGWDMYSTDQVGQEILIISLLGLLEKEQVFIEFPQLSALRAVRDAKLAKIPSSTIYKTRSTLYHSLEAFIGHIDFDNVGQWQEANGSFMDSPAATAAYLMNSSSWDDKAESYLKDVVSRDDGAHRGGVPCAWPTTIFDISWVTTTLATVGVSPDPSDSLILRKTLQDALQEQKGLLGFAPGILPDVDDTAKGLEALHHLGSDNSVEAAILTFEGKDHFLTYPGERNPSFSANCNILTLLLTREDRDQFLPQISKAVQFLTSQAFNGHVKEKWHRSELYWMMLLSHSFELFYRYEEIARAVFRVNPVLQEKIPMVLLQVLIRILHSQQRNGSWIDVCETTSYGILALSSLLRLPFVRQLEKGEVFSSMALGKSFLQLNKGQWGRGHYMWTEKVTYSSDILSETYCLAALLIPFPSTVEPVSSIVIGTPCKDDLFLVPDQLLMGMRKTGSLLVRTPLIRDTEPGIMQLVELQACFALQALQRQPPDIFPRTAKGKDKYIFIIPLALLLCAEVHGCSISVSVLYEMMVLSILNFHADEYMEGVVEKHFSADLDVIRGLVGQLFTSTHSHGYGGKMDGKMNGHSGEAKTIDQSSETSVLFTNGSCPTTFDLEQQHDSLDRPSVNDVKAVLSSFVDQILEHPAVQSSPARLQGQLASELQTFILAHIMHAEDNHRLRTQSQSNGKGTLLSNVNGVHAVNGNSTLQYDQPGRTFYRWVRSTSADHTSCPFSFVFFNCLVDAALSDTAQTRNGGILSSARTAYLAEDACRHLASLCRMYNDYGSLERDVEEHALNSVNFPEFFYQAGKQASPTTSSTSNGDAKSELLWIAEYERRGLDAAMNLLEKELGSGELMSALRMFVDVTDLYGQIYVLKDITAGAVVV